jgi:hypothetical protein
MARVLRGPAVVFDLGVVEIGPAVGVDGSPMEELAQEADGVRAQEVGGGQVRAVAPVKALASFVDVARREGLAY